MISLYLHTIILKLVNKIYSFKSEFQFFTIIMYTHMYIGYEPADLTVHPPPELPRVGSFFSYRCLVFPKNVLKGKPEYFGVI